MLLEKIKWLPDKPGVYQFKHNDQILYIGKAKNISKRVNQYFSRSTNARLTKLINQANDIEIIITNNEKEALILEHNLIKAYMPPYNILLKDNKRYPYIYISAEKHPKISIKRQRLKKGKFFGPFPDGASAMETVKLLNRLFPLRQCKTIPKETCLYYHIDQCLGPCIHDIKEDKYEQIIKDIELFLKGNTSTLTKSLKEKMLSASEKLDFEHANDIKKILQKIELFSQKQAVEHYGKVNNDYIGYAIKRDYIVITIVMIRNGKILDMHNNFCELIGEPNDIVESFLMQWYETNEKPKALVSNEGLDLSMISDIYEIDLETPTKGKNFEVLEIANNTANSNLNLKLTEFVAKVEKKEKTQKLINDLIGKEISVIELFDNSHTMGDNPVSAMVQFVNFEYNKKQSRKYNIQSSTNDDVASMREVVYRRLNSLNETGDRFPDLILVDGGKGQINAAEAVIEMLKLNIPVAGLAKDNKHKTDRIIYKDKVIDLKKEDRNILNQFGYMQDVIHRFAITFHRQKKRKSVFKSELENIEGLGKVRQKRLLEAFENVKAIKNASVDELSKWVPKDIAIKVEEYFKNTLDTKS